MNMQPSSNRELGQIANAQRTIFLNDIKNLQIIDFQFRVSGTQRLHISFEIVDVLKDERIRNWRLNKWPLILPNVKAQR